MCWQELLLAWKKFHFNNAIKHEANSFVDSEAHTEHAHPILTNMESTLTQMGCRKASWKHLACSKRSGDSTQAVAEFNSGWWTWWHTQGVFWLWEYNKALWGGKQLGQLKALTIRSSEYDSTGMLCNVKYGGSFVLFYESLLLLLVAFQKWAFS